ncbi:tripartite tricarboxylate transporter substrate binding protein [Xylophilus rhododendri]|uniref:Tripartite tricarboxylate transporter substrate binding protein n=1 Tax=Xylophilus rhododendri TaxID=2697032 RepID=A0A857J9B3_9BURK|nr:tripartite tricarboxylate transporter substrate binding protein [Xylophilus rhododendri]QHJ00477.1 tripartite tricarboxylate transporter substrate binding protein [Xylophilus rhododendri]
MSHSLVPRWFRLAAAAALLLPALAVQTANAQAAFPNRTVRMLVGFSPGGSNDIIARLVAPGMAEALGQPVLIENRPGAGGNIAADLMVKSTDGHTVMICTAGSLSILPHLQPYPNFNPETDVLPVSLIANTPLFLAINPKVPANNVAELIAYAKANPGKLNFASSGNGTTGHLAGEMFKTQAGIDIVHVPYKGTGQVIADILAGEVSMMFDQPVSSYQYVKAGKLKALAIASLKRLPSLPDLPTMVEAGLPGFDPVPWTGLCAPKGMPAANIALLQKALVKALRQPEVMQRLLQDGVEPIGNTPEEFKTFLANDKRKWGQVIKSAGVRLE